MIKIIILILTILFQFNCGKSLNQDNLSNHSNSIAQDNLKEPTLVNPLAIKIKNMLREDWDVSESGSKIFIVRRNPVSFYNGISLPAFEDARSEMIEQIKRADEYKIILEFGDRLSDREYRELKKINDKTEAQLEKLEERMNDFRGKGDFLPKTSEDEVLYEDYKQALRNLPYNKLPDLHNNQFSIYIDTTRYYGSRFYYLEEESECKAVLKSLYSLAEPYKERNVDYSNFPSENDYKISKIFDVGRRYDRHLVKKDWNLPKTNQK